MHTEHLQNVHPGWVAGGWLVALAVTSLVALVLASIGVTGEGGRGDEVWTLVALAIGFLAGGFFIGFKSIEAPLLHAIGIGLFTIVAWFALNVVIAFFFDELTITTVSDTVFASALVVQLVAAVLGAWIGHRLALAGGPEPEESAIEALRRRPRRDRARGSGDE